MKNIGTSHHRCQPECSSITGRVVRSCNIHTNPTPTGGAHVVPRLPAKENLTCTWIMRLPRVVGALAIARRSCDENALATPTARLILIPQQRSSVLNYLIENSTRDETKLRMLNYIPRPRKLIDDHLGVMSTSAKYSQWMWPIFIRSFPLLHLTCSFEHSPFRPTLCPLCEESDHQYVELRRPVNFHA